SDAHQNERGLQGKGLGPAASQPQAVFGVRNPCRVPAAANQDARAAVRRAHRENPNARILVTGCYAQRAPAEVAALPGVTWVVGNSHKHRVAEIAASGKNTLDFVPLENLALSSPAFTLTVAMFAQPELIAAQVFA